MLRLPTIGGQGNGDDQDDQDDFDRLPKSQTKKSSGRKRRKLKHKARSGSRSADCELWKVTYIGGVYVRASIDLESEVLRVLQHGEYFEVYDRKVNDDGLERLQLEDGGWTSLCSKSSGLQLVDRVEKGSSALGSGAPLGSGADLGMGGPMGMGQEMAPLSTSASLMAPEPMPIPTPSSSSIRRLAPLSVPPPMPSSASESAIPSGARRSPGPIPKKGPGRLLPSLKR